MTLLKSITVKNLVWGRRTWYQRRSGKVTGSVYADTVADSDQTDDIIHTLKLADNALRGEDYPALVRVWDNDVDAAIYDTD